jgi:hypothetical protein
MRKGKQYIKFAKKISCSIRLKLSGVAGINSKSRGCLMASFIFLRGVGYRFAFSICYNANIPTRRGDLWILIGTKSRQNT